VKIVYAYAVIQALFASHPPRFGGHYARRQGQRAKSYTGTMSTPIPSNYVLGQSVHEYERLMLQGRLLRPYTEKFLRAAGVVPGMQVLDVGSGMGDVALLAADMVGPGGRVLGIDRDSSALDHARRRAAEQGCSSWVSFQAANLDEFETGDKFDALVGRYILLYQPNAAATIRYLLRYVKR